MNSVTCDLEMFILKRACLVCISGLFEPFPSEGTLTRKNGKVRCSLLLVKTITIIIGSNTTAKRCLCPRKCERVVCRLELSQRR